MALIYITGAPGAGKSTLKAELIRRGYDAYDLDGSGFGGPRNKLTGERTTVPPLDQRTPEWFDVHEWRIDLPAIESLRSKSRSKDIFLCGVAESDGEMMHLFDKILYLQLDDAALQERLLSRRDNDFGKNEFELKTILERKHKLGEKYAHMEVIRINGSGTLTEIIDDIVRACNIPKLG